jgi:hypothetical protein
VEKAASVLMKLRRATRLKTAIFFSGCEEKIHRRAHSAAEPQSKFKIPNSRSLW